MTLWGDERGQSIQIGAVLLFGALIVAFSSYQAFVVPEQNKKVEFNHNRNVQTQLQELRDAIVSMPGDPTTQSVSIQLGTQYPSRAIAINPGPPAGALRTVGTTDAAINVSIENATAGGELGDFWNGTMRNYSTGGLVYAPNYNEYKAAPKTAYEHGVLYNEFDSGTVTLADQPIVDDNRITLVLLNGSLQTTQSGTTTVDVKPVSVSSNTVTVSNTTAGSNVTLRLPTRLSESEWERVLDGEFTSDGGHVYNVTVKPYPGSSQFDMVVIRLEPNVTYTLQIAKVGVGATSEASDRQQYLTDVSGNDTSVAENGTTKVVVEVRDKYNNPVSGATVYGNATGDGNLTQSTATTGGDGRAAFVYESPENVDGGTVTERINVSIRGPPGDDFDGTTPRNVTLYLNVLNSDGSGSGGGGGAYSVTWEDESNLDSISGVDCSVDPCEINGSKLQTLDLKALTSPTVDGADVTYAVSDKSVGTLSPASATFDSNGEHTTTLSLRGNGNLKVYVSSGGAGDVLEFKVVNFEPSDIAETGRITLTGGDDENKWRKVELAGNYDDPVVIAKPASDTPEHVKISIRKVTGSNDTFQWRADEFGGDPDSISNDITFHYIVVEEGVHQLKDGTIIEAGTRTVGESFQTVNFKHTFGSTPVVFSQPQTQNTQQGGERVTLVTRHESGTVTTTSFDVQVEDSEAIDSNPSETVGYVVVEQTSGTNDGTAYEVGTTGNSVTHNFESISFSQGYSSKPVVFAQMQTEDGPNTAWERYKNLDKSGVEFGIDEETQGDSDTRHTTENVGYFVYGTVGSIRGVTSANLAVLAGVPEATGDEGQRASFVIQNTGSEKQLRIQRIAINSTSSGASTVTYSGNELTTNGTGTLDTTLSVPSDAQTLDSTAVVPIDGALNITLRDFQDGSGTNVSLQGENVNVTIYYDDASNETYVVDFPPNVTLSQPNGGEQLAGGSTYTIKWSTSDSIGIKSNSVTLEYSTDGGSTWTQIASGEADDGSYDWTVPNTVTSSNVLVNVTVEDSNGGTGYNTSDNTFTIDSTPPTVTVSDPNGGETLNSGETYTIQWSASDTGTSVKSNSATIEYSTDGGSTWTQIATNEGGGSYDWTVPELNSSQALVRVTVEDQVGNTGSDQSDGTFTISNAGPGIAFAGQANGDLSTVDENGRISRSIYDEQSIEMTGPQKLDFKWGDDPDLPFIDQNTNIVLVDQGGNKTTLATSSDLAGSNRIAIGEISTGSGKKFLTGTGPFVYFADDGGKLARVDASGTVTRVSAQGNTNAQAVAGTGDIDDDPVPELVYVNDNSKFYYIDENNKGKAESKQLPSTPTLNTANAVGEPADFDGDGFDEIPYVDGSTNVVYINGPNDPNGTGTTVTLASGVGTESPLGVRDYTGDGTVEIIYVDSTGSNPYLKYVNETGTPGFVRDADGNKIAVKTSPGASSLSGPPAPVTRPKSVLEPGAPGAPERASRSRDQERHVTRARPVGRLSSTVTPG